MTSVQTPAVGSLPVARGVRPAAYALFLLLVASQVAIVVFSRWEPVFDGTVRFADIAPIREAYWPMNVLVNGPAYALTAVTVSGFLTVLGAGRGRALTLAGAVVHLVAGLVFALVITAEALPFAWAADPAIVDEAQGRALFDAYNTHLDAFAPYIVGSMAAVALGALLAVLGATLSGGLPRWVPVVTLGLIVGVFALPLGHPFAPVVDLGIRILFGYIGWRGLRALTGRA